MAAAAGIWPVITPPGPGVNLNDSEVPRITVVSIAFIAISTITVALRFLARRLSGAGFWWDDWTILAALIFSWGPCCSMLYFTNHGLGRHIGVDPDIDDRVAVVELWFKVLYVFETVYTVAVVLAKYSILLFYSRIFKEKRFEMALKVIFATVTLWFVAIEAAVLTECIPISALWNPAQTGTCINLSAFYQAAGIPNIILNTVILILPLPMIWSLDIARKHKIALSGVFLLGSFVVVVSIIRVVILSRLTNVDITWTYVDAGIWTAAEPTIAVTSASLPILRSLWIWNQRKRTAANEISDESLHENMNYPSKGYITSKKMIGSVSSQHYPLNELPASIDQVYGNQVTISADNRPNISKQISHEGDDQYADLPIMIPQDAMPPSPALQPVEPFSPAPTYRSELYG